MNRLNAAMIAACARCLSPEQREAVLGDLAESGALAGEILRSLLGCMIRRPLYAWRRMQAPKDLSLWIAGLGVALPLGVVLALASSRMAARQAVYFWMYGNNWTPTYLSSGWLWSELFPMLGHACVGWLLLASGAWAGGFALASTTRNARRRGVSMTAWLISGLFTLALIGGDGSEGVGIPPFASYGDSQAPRFNANAVVFGHALYRVGFPVVFVVLLVLLPALGGVFASLHSSHRRGAPL